jgi:hypothetical protein
MVQKFTIVRILLGSVLLVAAGLKIYGLSYSAVPQVGWFSQPRVQIATAEWELVLGLWLIYGIALRSLWSAASITFLIFGCISGYLGCVGVASCGCFGTLRVSPWYAFILDVAAVVSLAFCRPSFSIASHEECGQTVSTGLRQSLTSGLIWVTSVLLFLIGLSVVGAWYAGSTEAAIARLRGESLSVDEPYLDFGSGHPDDSLERILTVRNWTNSPVRLIGGTSDCSCTSHIDLPITIEPLSSATVRLRLRVPRSPQGQMTRTAFLWSDCMLQTRLVFRVGCRID